MGRAVAVTKQTRGHLTTGAVAERIDAPDNDPHVNTALGGSPVRRSLSLNRLPPACRARTSIPRRQIARVGSSFAASSSATTKWVARLCYRVQIPSLPSGVAVRLLTADCQLAVIADVLSDDYLGHRVLERRV